MKCQLNFTILFIALVVLCVSTVQSRTTPGVAGCHKGYCWKYCVNTYDSLGNAEQATELSRNHAGTWCYTTTSKEKNHARKKCTKDSDCDYIGHNCTGGCSK